MLKYLLVPIIIFNFADTNLKIMNKSRIIEIFSMSERKDGKLSLTEYSSLLSQVEAIFDYDKLQDCYYYYIPIEELAKVSDNDIEKLAFDGWIINANETKIIKFC
jgi:hypothetical protein